MAIPPKPPTPLKFHKPPLGKTVPGPFQVNPADTGNTFESDIIREVVKRTEPGYEAPTVGDFHPDTDTYPNHRLIIAPIPQEDGETVELLYARLRVSTDQELTEEYGGGVVKTSHEFNFSEPAIDQGLTVLKSSIEDLNDGRFRKDTVQLDGDEWPEITGEWEDPTYGIVVDISKKVVPAGTTYPGIAVSLTGPHLWVDINPLDKWRSIQICSKVDPDTLPEPVTWYSTHELDLPATLLDVVASWDRTGGIKQTADVSLRGVATAAVTIASGVLGSIEVLFRHNYRGPALARVTETFLIGPPGVNDIFPITKIIPVTGTASLIGKHVSFSQSRGTSFDSAGTNSEDGNEGQLKTESKTFGPFLSGAITSGTTTFTDGTTSAGASAGPDLNGNTFSAELVLPGSTGSLHINIPVSTPTDITPGQWITVFSEPQRWRFDVWVIHSIEVQVPL